MKTDLHHQTTYPIKVSIKSVFNTESDAKETSHKVFPPLILKLENKIGKRQLSTKSKDVRI